MVQDVVADAMPALVERVKAAHTLYTRIPGTPRVLPQTDTLSEQPHSPTATAASSSAAPVDKQPPMRVSQGQSMDTAVVKLQQEVSRDTYDVLWCEKEKSAAWFHAPLVEDGRYRERTMGVIRVLRMEALNVATDDGEQVERLASMNRQALAEAWAARQEAAQVARESAALLQRKLSQARNSAKAAVEGLAFEAVRC
jgi:hypothetical protein